MIVYNSSQARHYINEQLKLSGRPSISPWMFGRAIRQGKVVHFKVGTGNGTRYDFTQADLDAYVATLTAPKGERVEVGE